MILFTTIFLFFIGLLCGSFFNVIVDRLHKNEKGIISGRSHCDNCDYKLGPLDLIPVFSWLYLKRKCRNCDKKISWQYPAIEIATALIFAIIAYLSWHDPYLLFFRLFVISVLWIITLSDLKYMEVPDQISIPSIGIIFLILIINHLANLTQNIPTVLNALLGALILLIFFFMQIMLGHYILKKDIVGGGDLRIAAIMGLALGWKLSLIALLLSYFIGTLFVPFMIYSQNKNLQSQVAFGPFLSLATFITLFAGDIILRFWMDLVGL